MSRRKRGWGKRLVGEQLESRNLLAGNVVVTVNGSGDLSIRGDSQDNCVEVQEIGGNIEVSGCLPADFGTATNINSGAGPFVLIGLIGRDLKVDLKGGHDAVFLGGEFELATSGVNVPRHLSVETGDGEDGVFLLGTVGGNTKIETGLHSDLVFIVDSTFTGKLGVETSRGDDIVNLTSMTVTGKTKIDTSDGEDEVIIQDIVDPSTYSDLEIELGQQDDFLIIVGDATPLIITGKLTVESSKGDDEIHLFTISVAGKTKLETSDGEDCVEFFDSIFSDLDVELGKHDDHLLITDTVITGKIHLDGSSGSDTFYDGLGNTPPDLTAFLHSFEDTDDPENFPCLLQ